MKNITLGLILLYLTGMSSVSLGMQDNAIDPTERDYFIDLYKQSQENSASSLAEMNFIEDSRYGIMAYKAAKKGNIKDLKRVYSYYGTSAPEIRNNIIITIRYGIIASGNLESTKYFIKSILKDNSMDKETKAEHCKFLLNAARYLDYKDIEEYILSMEELKTLIDK